MSFTFGGYPVYCPGVALQDAQGDEAAAIRPIETWFGKPNNYVCTLGCRPGTGYLLMLGEHIAAYLDEPAGEQFLKLRMFGHTTEDDKEFAKMLISGTIEAIAPSARGATDTLYLVPIADRRWLYWDRGQPITATFNLRADGDGSYIASSMRDGVSDAWTWQEMLDRIWPSAAGTAPTLPFTPHGTPEGFWFATISRMRAYQFVLDRLACNLKYNPLTDAFSIVRLGSTADTTYTDYLSFITDNAKLRIWDDDPYNSQTNQLPETVRTRFRVKPGFTSDLLPYTTKDTTVDPAAETLGDGTYVVLEDDLYALSTDGAEPFTNDATLIARAAERTTDYVRWRQNFTIGEHRMYDGVFVESALKALGTHVEAVSWEDRGETDAHEAGMITSLRSGLRTDHTLEDWTRPEFVWPTGIDYKTECVDGTNTRYKRLTPSGPWVFDSYQGCCDCPGGSTPGAGCSDCCLTETTDPATLHVTFDAAFTNSNCTGCTTLPTEWDMTLDDTCTWVSAEQTITCSGVTYYVVAIFLGFVGCADPVGFLRIGVSAISGGPYVGDALWSGPIHNECNNLPMTMTRVDLGEGSIQDYYCNWGSGDALVEAA